VEINGHKAGMVTADYLAVVAGYTLAGGRMAAVVVVAAALDMEMVDSVEAAGAPELEQQRIC
jgi:hypothetical protein